MRIFRKKVKVLPVPKECRDFEIEIDKSNCTGEMTVGFRNPQTGKLMYEELARSEVEVELYKRKYGKQ